MNLIELIDNGSISADNFHHIQDLIDDNKRLREELDKANESFGCRREGISNRTTSYLTKEEIESEIVSELEIKIDHLKSKTINQGKKLTRLGNKLVLQGSVLFDIGSVIRNNIFVRRKIREILNSKTLEG